MEETNPTGTDANWNYTGKQTQYDGADMSQAGAPQTQGSLDPIQWSASEYLAHTKSTAWYGQLIAGATLLIAIIFIITRDIFASIAVGIACITVGAFASRPPATKQYTLSEEGIRVDDKLHPHSLFKSFSIVEEGGIDSIWLKPLKRFSPMVVMYFSPTDEARIVDMLSKFLPHEQRELDGIDKLSRKMRF